MSLGPVSPLAGPRLHYVTAVWGEAFTRRFIDAVLPTHASAGNLAALGDRPGDIYRVYTTAHDAVNLRDSAIWRRITTLVDARIEDLEPWLARGLDKYAVLGAVHQRALEHAHRAHAAAVFLAPDGVFGDGAFRHLRDLTLRGVRRVLVPGIRAEAGAWLADVRAHRPQQPGEPWTVPPRAAVAAALRHAHPLTRALRWDAPRLHAHPSHLYFTPPDGVAPGWVARAFHVHPLLVWPRELHGTIATTVDGDLDRVAPLPDREVRLVTSSDEIAAVELSDANAFDLDLDPALPRDGRAAAVARWAQQHADVAHRRYFRTSLRFVADDADEHAWAELERLAQRAADAITRHHAALDHEAPADPSPTNASATESADLTPAERNAKPAPAKLHFIVPVWGKTYIDRYLRWGLPNHLAPSNLPAVTQRTHSYDIVTDAADLPHFQHPAIDRLKALVPVRFRTPADDLHRHGLPDDSLGYTKMTRYYNAAVAAQTDPTVAHVFLTPEGIFSNGMFPALLARLDAGYRAVALPGFRVAEEHAIDELLAHHFDHHTLALSASSRELIAWVRDHPHPITQGHVWGHPWGTHPKPGPRLHSHYYFPVDHGQQGFVAHCFHVHPMCVWPTTPGHVVPPGQTLDHEYLQNAVPSHRVHYVTDTDEMCGIDIAAQSHLAEYPTEHPYEIPDVVDFAAQWTNGLHRWFFSQGVCAHTDGIDPDLWQPVRDLAHGLATDIALQLNATVEMPLYAQSRAAQQLQAQLAAQQAHRPRWIHAALRLEQKQAALRRRADEVGWCKVFALRTRLRRAARRAIERFTLSDEDRGRA